MKKKLMLYMLTTVVISLVLVTSLFIFIENKEYENSVKSNLNENNQFIIDTLISGNVKDPDSFLLNSFKSSGIRVTYIDKNGNVLTDSEADKESMSNHNNRQEVIDARKNKTGYSIRYSNTIKKRMLYFATEFGDGYIIRSSMPMESLYSFENIYIKYFLAVVLIVFIISIILCLRLTHNIVQPIKELQNTTYDISGGKLDKRVNISSRDEIGELGKTFNSMADKLQKTLMDLMDKQNKLEAILKSMESGVIAVDNNYKVIMINPYAENIFGIDKNIIGQNLLDSIRDFEFEDILKNSNADYNEMKILWPKERILRIRKADIITEGSHIGTVAVIQDITDIRRLENIRSEFVANVSHELKTPLTSIKGFAETLKYVNDNEKKEQFLDIINDEAERLTRLINDILTLSDIENNTDIGHEDVSIKKCIEDICTLMKHTAEGKNISLSCEIEKDVVITGSEDKVKQMLLNLVDNAIKYSESGGKVLVKEFVQDDRCIIFVQDTGIGIPQSHIGRLFERFYRVDKARSREKGGTGLGLAIVKHIALALNGSVEVESELGKGSIFKLNIPVKKAD